MRPARGRLIVQKPDTEETMPGGRIVLTQNERERMSANQVSVIAAGAPELCTRKRCRRHHDGNTHPHGIKAGDWLLIQHRALIEADKDKGYYIISQNDALAIFRTDSNHHDAT